MALGFDDGSWLTTAYSAGELIAMPFSAWFAITLSVRRLELWMLGGCTLLALILPFIHDLDLFADLALCARHCQRHHHPAADDGGAQIPAAPIRLYGLALYAMTATFAPNLSIWLAGHWTDGLQDWRWVYWQIIPLALIAAGLIAWGLAKEPIQVPRFRQANWFGMACGVPAFGLITVALDQGVRLDWFNSPLITSSLLVGLALLAIYLLTEWYHPSPFIKLQILGRRNLGLGCTLFFALLVVLMSSALLPANYLGALQDYRPFQMASVGLIVALPQLVLGARGCATAVSEVGRCPCRVRPGVVLDRAGVPGRLTTDQRMEPRPVRHGANPAGPRTTDGGGLDVVPDHQRGAAC
nr:hypothetical protein GCM10020185_80070 [Pseudomonas brassicacearum subsp. brassicacearum]